MVYDSLLVAELEPWFLVVKLHVVSATTQPETQSMCLLSV